MSENADFLRSPSHYKHILFTVGTGGINAGEIALVSEVYVIAFNTYTAAEIGTGVSEADMCQIPKKEGTGEEIAAGDFLYLDTGVSPMVVSTTQGTGDIKVGWAIEAATATATHVTGCWKGGGL